ncbi:MAG: hypothetical protein GC180_03635 [Bacteroidetes bacterium]|nr:hypothetical protein [Bacteroidota bacterium]
MKAGRYKPLLMMFLVMGTMTLGAKLPHPTLLGTPFTFQSFFLCLTALYFTPMEAGIGQVLYVISGFFIPVFATDVSGWAAFNSAGGGYYLAYPMAAWVLARYGRTSDWFACFSWTIVAHFILLLIGVLWQIGYLNIESELAFKSGMFDLLPSSFLKGGLAAAIFLLGEAFLKKRHEA